MVSIRTAALLVALAAGGAAWAGPLEDGIAAFQKGDHAAAFRTLKPLADKGNAHAQVYLGIMYYNGEGVPEDVNQAYRWFRRAAEAGDAEGQFRLGYVYTFGFGIPQDVEDPNKRAAEWYAKAAQQGHAEAQYNLGLLYLAGTGVPQDNDTGMRWIRKAADQGFKEARAFVGDYKKK